MTDTPEPLSAKRLADIAAVTDGHRRAGYDRVLVHLGDKEEWLRACADRFEERGGMDREEAEAFAQACWDVALEREGSEESVIENWSPVDDADEEMSCWEPG